MVPCLRNIQHAPAMHARPGKRQAGHIQLEAFRHRLLSPLHGVPGASPCQWSRVEINSLIAVQGVLPRVVAVLLRCFVGKEQV